MTCMVKPVPAFAPEAASDQRDILRLRGGLDLRLVTEVLRVSVMVQTLRVYRCFDFSYL